MKKALVGTLLLVLVLGLPVAAMAGVNVDISISLPPLIEFTAPPMMVVIPETYVYAVPDLAEDIYFYNGWWWRPWEGHWYRSRHYNSGWAYYQRVPSFYTGIPSGWRNDYRDHRWEGHQWDYQRIPHQKVQRNWNAWEKSRHWEKQQTWGVQGLQPRAQSQHPSQAVRPEATGKPHVREEVRPQQPRPQPGVPQQQHLQYQPVRQPVQESTKPQPQPPQPPQTPQRSEPHQEKSERGGQERN